MHFTRAQIRTLAGRGFGYAEVPFRHISLLMHNACALVEGSDVKPTFETREATCAVIETDGHSDLVILPDGSERWVKTGF